MRTAKRGRSLRPRAFIAETAADLVRRARSHQFEPLGHLLRMAEFEAEEYLRLRGKGKRS